MARGRTAAGQDQQAELAELRAQLREASETIEAIRQGGVDSLIIGPPGREQVYTLTSADRPYRLIVEAMSEGAATVSPRGVILNANPRLGEMTGRGAAALAGTPALDLARPSYRPIVGRLLEVTSGATARGEVELAGAGGEPIPVLLSVSAFDLDSTHLRCLVVTDLSAQRRAEAEIRALNAELEARVTQRTAELERVNKSMESFTYSVSHDLQAPLRALNGWSEALLEDCAGALNETGRGYARRIQAASVRMADLINDLLQLSRVSRAGMRLEPVDLSGEVAAAVAELRAREPGRRVRVAIQDGVRVTADRNLLRTVAQNLVSNAWKFTGRREDAAIEFAAAPGSGGMLRCSVRDNGVGFDPAYADKLFQPFQRLHAAEEFPGTGIGLASVRQIIERHGGRAWAEGKDGGGAVFYFTLRPAEADGAGAAARR